MFDQILLDFIQDFSFTDLQQIVYEDDLCLDVAKSHVMAKVDIQMCHYMGGNQKWEYNNFVSALFYWECSVYSSCDI